MITILLTLISALIGIAIGRILYMLFKEVD
jgi:ABC-type microcin C transport system permease subunit YejE